MQWKSGLPTPIYKNNGDVYLPQFHRPLYTLSVARKSIEVAVAEEVAQRTTICERQFGFQRGLEPTATLIDFKNAVKNRNNRVVPLDLTKAYDRVNKKNSYKTARST